VSDNSGHATYSNHAGNRRQQHLPFLRAISRVNLKGKYQSRIGSFHRAITGSNINSVVVKVVVQRLQLVKTQFTLIISLVPLHIYTIAIIQLYKSNINNE
jgi:hypothetical protein